MKSGKQTTEFKLTVAVNLVSAVLTIFIGSQLIQQEQADSINQLVASVAAIIPMLIAGYVTAQYTKSRTAVKVAEIELVGGESGLPE